MHLFYRWRGDDGKVVIAVAKVRAANGAAATMVALPAPLVDALVAVTVGTRKGHVDIRVCTDGATVVIVAGGLVLQPT